MGAQLMRLLWSAPPAAAPARRMNALDIAAAFAPPIARMNAMDALHAATLASLPRPAGVAMDDAVLMKQLGGLAAARGGMMGEAVTGYFAQSAMPMSYHTCAQLSAHWLIDKACHMPARDAVRQGYILEGADDALVKRIQRADKRMRIARNLVQFVHMGRVFGVRLMMFRVDSREADYYEHPFNPDGVTPGSYKGIVQVDPYWCVPELDIAASVDPTSPHYYEPTFWIIGGKRVHRSHLVIFRNGELPDFLKPSYRYGGVSVPQRIVERVYAAERTANEAPELAMSKRTTTLGVDLAEAQMNEEKFYGNLDFWTRTRNNYGVKVHGTDDKIQQFDTTLADFDALTMNQFQLVAAAANVPATKLLGTTPKGFNSSGEYEEATYHEELESIQAHDLTPVLDRHHLLLLRSWGLTETTIDHTWEALDTPTAVEYADIQLKKAQTFQTLQATGAVDAEDIRNEVRMDRESWFYGIEAGELDADPDPLLTSPSTPTDEGQGNEQPGQPQRA